MNYIGKSFKHYKGNIYKILSDALDSETLEEVIVYVDLNDTSKVWVRPKEMFFENVIFEGHEVPRFAPID